MRNLFGPKPGLPGMPAPPAGGHIIGQPDLLGAAVTVVIRCTCEQKTILVGNAASPFSCPTCRTIWNANAGLQLNIAPLGKQPETEGQNGQTSVAP